MNQLFNFHSALSHTHTHTEHLLQFLCRGSFPWFHVASHAVLNVAPSCLKEVPQTLHPHPHFPPCDTNTVCIRLPWVGVGKGCLQTCRRLCCGALMSHCASVASQMPC